ncbi:pyridoxal phosphate-dependent aminotransferase [Pseudomonas sp. R2-7-07]|uniref:pyridoxal phosphate-dependent aminotransferase n=1 Tax=Pseudomonas sp. R2-7-07 TaxID=658641 RepID=UPI000F6EBDF5|nr:aminotransferase class I/II-fold pyridoxal phosphate-dependent enzyme [Pseudomonas sp. R2-7-07]AZF49733.1 Aspartate aminotransferase [Pseudomonas sp. R2-7-07]
MNNSEPSAVSLPLSRRAQRLRAPGTSSMRSKANALKEASVNVINFAAGELSFDACPAMKAAVSDALANARNRYTPPIGLPQLRQALAQQVTQRCGVNYAADEVAVTAGAKQALYNAAMVLLDPGDEVIVAVPYWETFPTQIQLAGSVPVYVDTAANDYRLTCAGLSSSLSLIGAYFGLESMFQGEIRQLFIEMHHLNS